MCWLTVIYLVLNLWVLLLLLRFSFDLLFSCYGYTITLDFRVDLLGWLPDCCALIYLLAWLLGFSFVFVICFVLLFNGYVLIYVYVLWCVCLLVLIGCYLTFAFGLIAFLWVALLCLLFYVSCIMLLQFSFVGDYDLGN